MKTGNSILLVFFVWLAVDLPIRIFMLSETYGAMVFVGMGRDEWMVFSFLLPFFFAIVFGICGLEKHKDDVYYKKPGDAVEVAQDEVVQEMKPVKDADVEGGSVGHQGNKRRTIDEIEDTVDGLPKDKKRGN